MCDDSILFVKSPESYCETYHVINVLNIFFAESDPCYICHEYANCYNRRGYEVCVCNDGYVGNIKYC